MLVALRGFMVPVGVNILLGVSLRICCGCMQCYDSGTCDLPGACRYLPAYALVNLKLGVDGSNGMHMDFFISNVMNRLVELSRYAASNQSVNDQVYILPAQPRTFGIEFGQEF